MCNGFFLLFLVLNFLHCSPPLTASLWVLHRPQSPQGNPCTVHPFSIMSPAMSPTKSPPICPLHLLFRCLPLPVAVALTQIHVSRGATCCSHWLRFGYAVGHFHPFQSWLEATACGCHSTSWPPPSQPPATESLQEWLIHSSHDMHFYTRFDLFCFSKGYSSALACTHTTTSFLQVWKMQPTLESKAGCKGRLRELPKGPQLLQKVTGRGPRLCELLFMERTVCRGMKELGSC